MNRLPRIAFCLALGLATGAGCGGSTPVADPGQSPSAGVRPPERSRDPAPSAPRSGEPKVTWDSDRDQPFAEFLRAKSAGMLREAAVAINRKGIFQVVLDRSVAPDDTLDLTKSLMAGARKDFPDRPITLAVFDPAQELILKAVYTVDQGVKYQLAGDSASGSSRTADDPGRTAATAPGPSSGGSSRSGVTAADRKFAEWAEEHGRSYLRYVEADLEKHGRLWFGVTPEVKPADLPALTKSLLEGARKEFPRGDLVASVFAPNGDKIGKATLDRGGSVSWER